MCTYTKVNYAITRIYEKAVRSDLPKQMKKPLMAYYIFRAAHFAFSEKK